MTEDDNTATGGLLVVLGIVVALGAGVFLYNQGIFGDQKADIEIDLPRVSSNS